MTTEYNGKSALIYDAVLELEQQKNIRSGGVLCALRIDLTRVASSHKRETMHTLQDLQKVMRLADFHLVDEQSLRILISDRTTLAIFRAVERLRLRVMQFIGENPPDDVFDISIWDFKNKSHYTLSEDEIKNGLAEVRASGCCKPPFSVGNNGSHSQRIRRKRLKRIIDILFSAFGLVICMPAIIIIAAAVKLSSPGPVIYTQTRVGHDGTPFRFYKFRSMRQNADESIHREYVTKLINGEAGSQNVKAKKQTLYKLANDYRLTPVGKFLRSFSLDELPQLYNVLKGDMSLVGPRPAIRYEVDCYDAWHLQRLQALPGLTGLWQVRGRSRTTFDDMVRYDIHYIRNRTLWLDLKILLQTVRVVLRRDGVA